MPGRSGKSSTGERIVPFWHRIRSGEDPLAFGAVVVVLALGAGLLWFWAGARHGGVAAASAAPEHPAESADRARRTKGASPRAEAGGPLPSGSGGPATATPFAPVGSGVAGGSGMPGGGLPAGRDGGLAVHVAGAVLHPGLYRLPAGSRVADAVASAGGSLARADLDRLNLAARLVDGQKVFVARRGEPVPFGVAAMGGDDGGGNGEPDPSPPSEPIDLNTAGPAALDSLPGIGPATARAILEERARRGGFRSTRDLLRIPGIGEGRFARLKDHVRV